MSQETVLAEASLPAGRRVHRVLNDGSLVLIHSEVEVGELAFDYNVEDLVVLHRDPLRSESAETGDESAYPIGEARIVLDIVITGQVGVEKLEVASRVRSVSTRPLEEMPRGDRQSTHRE